MQDKRNSPFLHSMNIEKYISAQNKTNTKRTKDSKWIIIYFLINMQSQSFIKVPTFPTFSPRTDNLCEKHNRRNIGGRRHQIRLLFYRHILHSKSFRQPNCNTNDSRSQKHYPGKICRSHRDPVIQRLFPGFHSLSIS